MSVMSEIFIEVTEMLDRNINKDEIAYQLTCIYPNLSLESAAKLVDGVIQFETDYLTEV